MAVSSPSSAPTPPFLLLLPLLFVFSLTPPALSTYSDDFYVTWCSSNVLSLSQDYEWQLMLDQACASGFGARKRFLFGSIDMEIKLVPGNSSGTVVAYYFSSDTTNRDEIDFEFLGNVSGQPYILQTNVYRNGTGGREQRIYLWFDPTTAFHKYSIIWNPQQITFLVDGVTIRIVFNDTAVTGIPYLSNQPLRTYASIWDGSSWATRGGQVKIDWTQAPFNASYGSYKFDACFEGQQSGCSAGKWWNSVSYQTSSANQQSQLSWVQQNYMVYNYCTDTKRYPVAPRDCSSQM